MVAFPKYFPEEPEQSIVSFNYIDITEGIGYVNFYPCAFKLSGSTTYGMAQSTEVRSGIIAQKANGAAASNSSDFYLTFNLPQRVRGYALLSLSLGTAVGNGSTGAKGMVVMSLYKVSGGVTTQLGSTVTSNVSGESASDTTITVLAKFDMSDQVYNFKKGDQLKLTVYLSGVGGSTSASGYGLDPSATADSANAEGVQVIKAGYSTRMVLSIPFVLER